jgi:hypothetical protein
MISIGSEIEDFIPSMRRKGAGVGAQNFTATFIALVEMITTGFTIQYQLKSANMPQTISLTNCPKFIAEFRSMERSVNGMKLHREKYFGDFIPYNLTELFQGCEKLEKFTSPVFHKFQ